MQAQEHKRRVLIYEPSYTGHHLKYVQLLVTAFAEEGWHVFIASGADTFQSVEYATLLRQYEHMFTGITVKTAKSMTKFVIRWLNAWHVLRIAVRRECRVFIPYLDAHFRIIGALAMCCPSARRVWLEGILFEGACGFDKMPKSLHDRVRQGLTKKLIVKGIFQRILFLNEPVLGCYLRSVKTARSRMELCPDPIELKYSVGREESRHRLGIPCDAKIMGVFGMIDSRKGVDLLIESLDLYRPQSNDYLLLMGKHTATIRERIRRCEAATNIVSIDHFVTDDEMISGINAVDVIACVYPRHATSASIVVRAAAAGKPILGSDYGWIGDVVERYELGMTCDVLDREALLCGLRWAFDKPRLSIDKASAFVQAHSVERFAEVVLAGSRLSRSSARAILYNGPLKG